MIISNDTELRNYIPNALVTVQGEQSLFDKLQVELQLSEMWLTNLIGTLPDDDVVRKVVATDAFLRAIPSLDLVLTPNGFGIVSNNTIAPASKDRVDRLLSSLEQNRDFALDQLLCSLLNDSDWRTTDAGRFWTATLFQSPLALPAELRKSHALDYFLQVRPQIVLIEQELAEKFISLPTYQRLRSDIGNADFAMLVEPLQAIELQLLAGKPLPYKQLISLVDYLRTHEEQFPEWQTSATAELFQPNYFQNKKDSAGYWW